MYVGVINKNRDDRIIHPVMPLIQSDAIFHISELLEFYLFSKFFKGNFSTLGLAFFIVQY